MVAFEDYCLLECCRTARLVVGWLHHWRVGARRCVGWEGQPRAWGCDHRGYRPLLQLRWA